MRSSDAVVDTGRLRKEERGTTKETCVVEVGVSLPRKTSGKVILVISGQSRMMYQNLKPEPEGAILWKRSKPQEDYSSPHDAGTSMSNWLKSTIQGGSGGTGGIRNSYARPSLVSREPFSDSCPLCCSSDHKSFPVKAV